MKKREKTFVDNEIEKEQQKNKSKPENKISFRQAFGSLPPVLMTTVMKRFGIAAIVLILTIVMLFVSKDVMICAGFLLALLAAYLGLDIIWKYADDKILVARMRVCKATVARKGQVRVILRDAQITNVVAQDFETYKYSISIAAKEDRENITEGTIMDIYICQNAPNAVLAYEILGSDAT